MLPSTLQLMLFVLSSTLMIRRCFVLQLRSSFGEELPSIPACFNKPCQNGVCLDSGINGSSYRCFCINGYTGYNCEINYNECQSMPCLNGATCIDDIAKANCLCPEGYTGQFCENDVNECLSNPCLNNGSCEDIFNGYICHCPSGFRGSRCEEDISICNVSLTNVTYCFNGGTCIDDIGDAFSCSCPIGYTGAFCETNVNECESSPCLNGGQCFDLDAGFICACTFGWTGQMCEMELRQCSENICQNGGLCLVDTSGTNASCYCVPDYHGEYCEERYNDCIPEDVCGSNGICIDGVNEFECQCLTGYKGPFCMDVVNCSNSEDAMYCITPSPSGTDIQIITTAWSDMHGLQYPLSKTVALQSVTSEEVHSDLLSLQHSLLNDTQQNTDNLTVYGFLTLPVSFDEQSYMWTSLMPSISSFFPTISLSSIIPVIVKDDIEESSLVLQDSTITTLISSVHTPDATTAEDRQKTRDFLSKSFPVLQTADFSLSLSQSFEPVKTAESPIRSPSIPILDSSYKEIATSPTYAEQRSILLSSPLYHSEQLPLSDAVVVLSVPTNNDAFLTPHDLSNQVNEVFATLSPSGFEVKPFPSLVSSSDLVSSIVGIDSSKPSPLECNITCENGEVTWNPETFQCECLCPPHRTGKLCEKEVTIQVPSFSGKGFLAHQMPVIKPNEGITIDVTFKTFNEEGVILYSEASNGRTTFIQLYISNGLLKFRFSCGHQVTVFVETDEKVNTGYFTTVSINLVWFPLPDKGICHASLQVNSSSTMTGKQFISSPGLELHTLYLGSVPWDSKFAWPSKPKTSSFVGCMKDLQINGKERYIVNDAVLGHGISSCEVNPCNLAPCKNGGVCLSNDNSKDWKCECPEGFGGHLCERITCAANPCMHGGTCIMAESGSYFCLCPYGRHGRNCNESITINKAAFYGNMQGYSSYVAYGVQDVRDHLEVRLKFTTSNFSQNSLLVYMGQENHHDPMMDFAAVYLENGFIIFQYDLGSGSREIRSAEPLDNRLSVHSVEFGRHRRYGWLIVDKQKEAVGLSPGPLTSLNVIPNIFFGGHPSYNFTSLPQALKDKDGFDGCLFELAMRTNSAQSFQPLDPLIAGRNIQQCSVTECHPTQCGNGGTCVEIGSSFECRCHSNWTGSLCLDRSNPCTSGQHKCSSNAQCIPIDAGYRCNCPLGRIGSYCERTINISDPLFTESGSYMALSVGSNIRWKTHLQIEFKPYLHDGLLFYTAQYMSEQSRDFLSVSLTDGYVEFRFNLGTGPGTTTVLRSNTTVKLGQWNIVEVGRNKRRGYLHFEKEEVLGEAAPGMEVLDTYTHFYLGGMPDLSDVSKEAVLKDPSYYNGCIRLLEVNGKIYDLVINAAVEGQNVDDCDGTACGYNSCKNGGTCLASGMKKFTCICQADYFGPICENITHCKSHICQNGATCIPNINSVEGYVCDCAPGFDGPFCSEKVSDITAAYFTGRSYMYFLDTEYKERDLAKTFMTLTFKANNKDAVIFWNGKHFTWDSDYLGVGLRNGSFHLVWNLGWLARDQIVVSNHNFADGHWHSLIIHRTLHSLVLNIDGTEYLSKVAGDYIHLNTEGHYYFGGFPRGINITDYTGSYFHHPFVGCLKDISVISPHMVIHPSNTTLSGRNIKRC